MKRERRSLIAFNKGFTLLEVMLSMVILSIIVYSVFTAFDKTMKVLDTSFTDAYQYEQIRRFFDQITKEVVSSTIDKSDEFFSFKGGPHWLEFATPLISDLSMSDYIQRGVAGLSTERRKIKYYSARINNYQDENNINGNRNIHLLFEHHLFRLFPLGENNNSSLMQKHFRASLTGSKSSPTVQYLLENQSFPHWLDSYKNVKLVSSNPGKKALKDIMLISEILSCRAVQFRYYYNLVTDVDENTVLVKEFYQDWWDSTMKYPSYNLSGSGTDLLTNFYNDALYDDYNIVDAERARRSGSSSLSLASHDGKYSFDESYLYELEDNSKFICFDESQKSYSEKVFANSYLKGLEQSTLKDNKYDPWFQKHPSALEVIVYVFDKNSNKLPRDIADNEMTTAGQWVSSGVSSAKLAAAYKGEMFSVLISIPTSSTAINSYYRDLVVE